MSRRSGWQARVAAWSRSVTLVTRVAPRQDALQSDGRSIDVIGYAVVAG